MTTYAVIMTLAAVLGWRRYLGQIRQTRAAKEAAAWWEAECKEYLDRAIDHGYLATAETDRADRMERLADKHEAARLDIIQRSADLDRRSLPAAPSPTADQSIPAAPYTGEPFTLDLPALLLGDHTCTAKADL